MERRSFLKNSLFSLVGVALTSNKALASVVESLTPESLKIMLYLVQTNSGEWKVKATKWVDLPKKRLKRCHVKPETFKLLDIVDYNDANKRKLELWKEHNCVGRFTPISIIENIKNGKKAITHPNYLSYRNSDKFKENMKKLNSIGGKYGGKIGAITKKEMGFDYRAASLKGAEVMRNMSVEKRLEYAERAIKIHTGRKRSDEVRKKFSEIKKGKPSPMKGKTFSEQARKNISKGAKNRKYTEEGLKKIKETFEKNRVKKGFKHSKETIEWYKENHPSKIKGSCIYCKKEFSIANLNRYHGEKCIVLTGVSSVTEEQRKKQSEKSKLQIRKTKKVNLYKYDNNYFLGTFTSYRVAAKWVDANDECLRLTIYGKRKQSNGYYATWAN